MFFASKQKKIQARISLYCKTVSDCVDVFKRSILQYCKDSDRDAVRESFHEVHKAESLADDIRREIEVMMYSKALFPESRGDILGLLETMDKVPNQAEACVQMIHEQRITIPEAFASRMQELTEVCSRCVQAMLDSVNKLFTDYTSATVAVGKIDELETEADHIESALKEGLFSSEMDGTDKILLRDLVKQVAGICDRAENVGDRIRIIVAKRGI